MGIWALTTKIILAIPYFNMLNVPILQPGQNTASHGFLVSTRPSFQQHWKLFMIKSVFMLSLHWYFDVMSLSFYQFMQCGLYSHYVFSRNIRAEYFVSSLMSFKSWVVLTTIRFSSGTSWTIPKRRASTTEGHPFPVQCLSSGVPRWSGLVAVPRQARRPDPQRYPGNQPHATASDNQRGHTEAFGLGIAANQKVQLVLVLPFNSKTTSSIGKLFQWGLPIIFVVVAC